MVVFKILLIQEIFMEPEFPQDFVENHCPLVLEARKYRKIYQVAGNDDMFFAECAFVPRGIGMQCESCGKFLTKPYCGRKVDEEFLPKIKDYYQQMDVFYKKEEELKMCIGGGI